MNAAAYKKEKTTVKLERVFTEEKTPKELVLEILKKRRDQGGGGA